MATPISYRLVLEGEDARDFEEDQKNPTFTKAGITPMLFCELHNKFSIRLLYN